MSARVFVKRRGKALAKTKKKMKRNEVELCLMCILPLFQVLLFKYIPMGGLVIAFKRYKYSLGIFGSEWAGFKNFEMFLTSNEFLRLVWNTLSMNFVFIILSICSATAIAILLYNVRRRNATKVFQTVMITPNFISWVIVAYMVFALLNPSSGLLNQILKLIGKDGIDWYSTPKAWPVILSICFVWKNVGMDSILYYAALMGIDTSLFEAADIDGAGRWMKIKHIILPELTSLITILSILKIGSIFNADFGLFYQVTRNVGALYPTTDVIDTYVFRTMRTVGDMSLSTAVSFLQSLVGMIMVIIANYVVKKFDEGNSLF